MGFYENAYRLKDGAVLVYTRSGRKKNTYQTRLKIPGLTGYVVRSLKTADLNAAMSEAEDLFYELRAGQKQGLDVRVAGNLRFKDLWKRFYDTHQTGLSIHRQRLHESFARNYFVPYFGEHRVADMPDAFVEKYWDWRINYYNPERRAAEGRDDPIPKQAVRMPSQKTLEMECGMLRQIFRWGKRVGCVKREPWIKPPKVKHTVGTERRPTFTEAEWKTVYEHMRSWVTDETAIARADRNGVIHTQGPTSLHSFQRQTLRHYLLFMANSGLRPNEARQLLWRDIRIESDEDGSPALIVEIAPTTKTGARTVVCRQGTAHYLERFKKLSQRTGPNDLVFGGHDGEPIVTFNNAFQKMLIELKLLEDRWGKNRTVYSLRHFYCTQSLLSGVPIHVLAKNMGTSIAHIEQHYSHVLTVMLAKQLQTKKFRPAKKEAKSVAETGQTTRQ